MPGDKQPPKGDKLGGGTGNQGRFSKTPPADPGTTVGHGPPYHATGLDALSPLLEHVDFPASRGEIKEQIGSMKVPVDKQSTRSVNEIMDAVTPDQFQSSANVEEAVKRVWDQVAGIEGRAPRHKQRDNLVDRPRHD